MCCSSNYHQKHHSRDWSPQFSKNCIIKNHWKDWLKSDQHSRKYFENQLKIDLIYEKNLFNITETAVKNIEKWSKIMKKLVKIELKLLKTNNSWEKIWQRWLKNVENSSKITINCWKKAWKLIQSMEEIREKIIRIE